MRVYYLFRINDTFKNLYNSKTFYLYKTLEEISKSSKNDFIISYKLFEQMAISYDKTHTNNNIYNSFYYDKYYKRNLNKHIYNDEVEKTILTVYNTYIKIKTNKNSCKFFKVLRHDGNIFVCDFNNKDYFWLSKVYNNVLV